MLNNTIQHKYYQRSQYAAQISNANKLYIMYSSLDLTTTTHRLLDVPLPVARHHWQSLSVVHMCTEGGALDSAGGCWWDPLPCLERPRPSLVSQLVARVWGLLPIPCAIFRSNLSPMCFGGSAPLQGMSSHYVSSPYTSPPCMLMIDSRIMFPLESCMFF